MVNELEAVFDVITTVQAAAVRRLRDAWSAEATKEACGRTTKAWLREELMLAGIEASRMMRLLHNLRCYPATEAAFDAAEITLAHAIAIISALETLPAHLRATVEPHLVERARMHPPEEIAGFVDQLLDALGIERASEIRAVDVHKTLDGTRSVKGTLTADVGDALERALALAGQPSGPEDDRSPRQRAHDALGAIANAYLGNDGEPSFDGSPRTVIITMDLETLENQLREQWNSLSDGTTISAATARRLACDAEIIPVVLGGRGEVLDIGQADHEFTTAIRRAAWIRDHGRCAFPRCANRPVELHHIVFRRRGGATSLDNAAWLCAFHHWLVHDGGWTLERRQDSGGYLWTSPTGEQHTRHTQTA
jgi:hypothetical protein